MSAGESGGAAEQHGCGCGWYLGSTYGCVSANTQVDQKSATCQQLGDMLPNHTSITIPPQVSHA